MMKIKFNAVAFLLVCGLATSAAIYAANKYFEKCPECKQAFNKCEFEK